MPALQTLRQESESMKIYKEPTIGIWFFVAATIMVVGMLAAACHVVSREKECDDLGGVLLKGSRGYVCVLVDQIKERRK